MNRHIAGRFILGVALGWASFAHGLESETALADARSAQNKGVLTLKARGAHHKSFERTIEEVGPNGEVRRRVEPAYTEIATGLNYLENGEWQESRAEFEITPRGHAVARFGQHKVVISPVLNDANGAVDLLTPEGRRMRSTILGLALRDRLSGTNLLVGQIKSGVKGRKGASNEIIFPDCFDNVHADVRFVFQNGAFHQDVILREALDVGWLEKTGFSPETSRLEIWTEFFEAPPVRVKQKILSSISDPALRALVAEPDVMEEELDFGDMRIPAGHAYARRVQGGKEESLVVPKRWRQIDGRTFLVESVSMDELNPLFAALPKPAARPGGKGTRMYAGLRPPAPKLLLRGADDVLVASVDRSPDVPGVVLDYQLVTGITDFTFRGDTTYYVSGDIWIYNVTLEGGAVIKYEPGVGRLNSSGSVTCKTDSYRPAVLTSKNDDTVGEIIAGSTGVPSTSEYTSTALRLYYMADARLRHLRFSHVGVGVLNYFGAVELRDSQFVKCRYPIDAYEAISMSLRNVLMSDVPGDAISLTRSSASAEHLTFNQGYKLVNGLDSSFAITNSLLTGVQWWGSVPSVTNQVVRLTSAAGVFQSVGAGYHYLATNSPYRNAGTTNINPALLVGLKQKTTYPPVLYSNVTVSTPTLLTQQAARDVDLPDIGYHYEPLDYLVDRFGITNAPLTVTNGVAIGAYLNNPGLWLQDGSSIRAVGTPDRPVHFTFYNTVQEQPVFLATVPPTNFTYACLINPYHLGATLTVGPTGEFRFAKFSSLAATGVPFYHVKSQWDFQSLSLRDCEIGTMYGYEQISVNTNSTTSFVNNLFRRTTLAALGASGAQLTFSNNLFWGSSNVTLRPGINGSLFAFNNVFDSCYVNSLAIAGGVLSNDFNAYLNCSGGTVPLTNAGINNIILTNTLAYQSGLLGDFYQPAGSPLLDGGSQSAAAVGLHYYTATTNHAPESNTPLDLGYHYLPVAADGTLLDLDGDGIPDYLDSDADGDFLSDLDEMQFYGTDFLNPDTDGDGRTDWQEWMDGTNPLNPASLATWEVVADFPVETPSYEGLAQRSSGPALDYWPTNGTFNFAVVDGDTNVFYDLFGSPTLVPAAWTWVGRMRMGGVYELIDLSKATYFYKLGMPLDTDGDGLTDDYELSVSHTSPTSRDTDGDGIEDGDELTSGGLPWRLEAVRKYSAVVYASQPSATEGGACGQFTLLLPTPAPPGGSVVKYRLHGTAALVEDFTANPAANMISVPAGSSSASISICAVNGAEYSDLDRYVEITLTNSSSSEVDGYPARVDIVENDPPAVRVLALPNWVREPSATFGTNQPQLFFIRDGAASNAVTAQFTVGGTATSGTDYDALVTSVNFPAGQRTATLNVNLRPDALDEGDETIVVNLISASGYQIDPQNGSGTVTIAANGFPALATVQVTTTDDDAREAGLNPGQFTFSRTGPTAASLRVFYRVTGTATTGSPNSPRDYVALTGFVDIPAGSASATVAVTPLDDTLSETVETVVVVLAAGDYRIGASNSGTVYLDDNEPVSYTGELIRHGVYTANSAARRAATVRVTRRGSALTSATMNWRMTYSYTPNIFQSVQVSGDANSSSVIWAARQSIATVNFTTLWTSYSENMVNPLLTLSNTVAQQAFATPHHPPSHIVSVSSATIPASTVNEGNTLNGALIFRRPYANANAFVLSYTQYGSVGGSDYTIVNPYPGQVQFAANQTQVTLPVQALTDSLPEGWETLVVGMNPNAANNQVPEAGQEIAFIRLQDAQVTNPPGDSDMDDDGLSDGYELAHLADGLNPLTANNPFTDDDRDGLGLFEEIQLGTDPNVADAQPVYPSPDEQDYLPLTLRLGASGKLAKTEGCATCHESGLRVGNHTRSTPRTSWESQAVLVDYILRIPKGTNHSVQLLSNPYSRVLASGLTNSTQEKYTAAYAALFLNGTNGYPFVVDTNSLLGTNKPLVLEARQKTATLFVPDLLIASDVDRDGVVNFGNRTDRTFTNAPLTFWVNEDRDLGNDDAAADEEVTGPALADSANTTIDSLRDLEDFSRLQFRIEGLPGQFVTNAGWQTRIALSNVTGSASLRLFRAVETNGGVGYLTNTTTGTAQMARGAVGVLTNGSVLTLAGTNWLGAGSNRFFLPFIFEGMSTGKCAITFGLASNTGPVVAWSRPFYLELKPVTGLYEHWTVGDNTTTEWSQIPNLAVRTPDSAVFGVPQNQAEMDYILFVHGWRMKPWERRSFASTAYKRMWHLGYKGRFGLFSWPTDYTETDILSAVADARNYDRSERRAWWSGIGLNYLLTTLDKSYKGRVRLLSHSMGGIPTSEALRIRGNSVRNNSPIVHSYVASQAASVAHAYDATGPETKFPRGVPNVYAEFPRHITNAPYFKNLRQAVNQTQQGAFRSWNFHNVQDYALTDAYVWPLNQTVKPLINELKYGYASQTWLGYPHEKSYRVPDDAYVIYSYLAPAHSPALGASVYGSYRTGVEIGNDQNLNAPAIGFTQSRWDHSAQFNGLIQRRLIYWQTLRQQTGL